MSEYEIIKKQDSKTAVFDPNTENSIDKIFNALIEVNEKDITVYYVPGAFEIPQTAKRVADKKEFDGIICLGTVIRGETPHFEYVASEVAKGIAKIGLDVDIPISFGIITADSTDQAIERAGTKSGNKGYDAAETVIEMINLFKNMEN